MLFIVFCFQQYVIRKAFKISSYQNIQLFQSCFFLLFSITSVGASFVLSQLHREPFGQGVGFSDTSFPLSNQGSFDLGVEKMSIILIVVKVIRASNWSPTEENTIKKIKKSKYSSIQSSFVQLLCVPFSFTDWISSSFLFWHKLKKIRNPSQLSSATASQKTRTENGAHWSPAHPGERSGSNACDHIHPYKERQINAADTLTYSN